MEYYPILLVVGFVGVAVLLLSSIGYELVDVLADHGKIRYRRVELSELAKEVNGFIQLVSLVIAVLTLFTMLSALAFYDSILIDPTAPDRLRLLLETSILITWMVVIVNVPVLHYKKLRKV